jgi:hypothetical protein
MFSSLLVIMMFDGRLSGNAANTCWLLSERQSAPPVSNFIWILVMITAAGAYLSTALANGQSVDDWKGLIF